MMFRTVRYFKLIYIVAVILMSNNDICETVDKIHIAPRVQVKELLQPKKQKQTKVDKPRRSWFSAFDFFNLGRLKQRVTSTLSAFSIWTIPNYFVDCSTNYISKKFHINSDCDLIYNK